MGNSLRYKLNHSTLGKLERLGKSRFHIKELSNEDLEDWQNLSLDANWNLAQSVNASSEIEGEAVEVDQLSILAPPATEPVTSKIDADLDERIKAIQSIYCAYLWMLSSDNNPIISKDLILECHKRMFETTKPDTAGILKKHEVTIKGGDYFIETLPASRTDEFLTILCEEFTNKWRFSEKFAAYSRFLLIAEFILDFLAIHPFEDGNGRIARLLSTYLLEKAGYHFARFYPVDSVILEMRRDYYEALYQGQRSWLERDGDITKWIEFYVNTIFIQWTRAFERVKEAYIKKLQDEKR